MHGDEVFRWTSTLAFFGGIGLSGYYRRRARRHGSVIPRRAEGAILIGARVGVAVPLFLGPLLYIANPGWMSWAALSLPISLRWAGVAMSAAALPVLSWTLRSLGRNISETVLTKADHQLVAEGPYRWVRHPLYATGIALFTAIGLMAANWFIILVAGIAAILIRWVVVPMEERELVKKFGDRYRSYMGRTGGLLPRGR